MAGNMNVVQYPYTSAHADIRTLTYSYHHHNWSSFRSFVTSTRPRPSWTFPVPTTQPLYYGDFISTEPVQTSATVPTPSSAVAFITTASSTPSPAPIEGSSRTTARQPATGSTLISSFHSFSMASSTRDSATTWSQLSSSVLSTSTSIAVPTASVTQSSTSPEAPQSSELTTLSTTTSAVTTTITSPRITDLPFPISRSSTTSTFPTLASITVALSTITVLPTAQPTQIAHSSNVPPSRVIAIAAALGSALAILAALLAILVIAHRRRERHKQEDINHEKAVLAGPPELPPLVISEPMLLPVPPLPRPPDVTESPVPAPTSLLPQYPSIYASPPLSPPLPRMAARRSNPVVIITPPPLLTPTDQVEQFSAATTPSTLAPSPVSFDSQGNVRRSDPFNLQHL